ncbi:hypothetical protein F4780DRAFT_729665 [Xylariomycetidae sp. FL0641]|nr:hypothetical protein F4780DRAFT_729665 [Xylariomycetidae sp. FL0641]
MVDHTTRRRCPHIHESWFGGPGRRPKVLAREPAEVLAELLDDAVISKDAADDEGFRNAYWHDLGAHRAPKRKEVCRFFTKLPSELRVMIWQHALPSRTLHTIDGRVPRDCWSGRLRPPPVFHTCREARAACMPLVLDVRDDNDKRTVVTWFTAADILSVNMAEAAEEFLNPWKPGWRRTLLEGAPRIAVPIGDLLYLDVVCLMPSARPSILYVVLEEIKICVPRASDGPEVAYQWRDRLPAGDEVIDVAEETDWRSHDFLRYPSKGIHTAEVVALSDRRRIKELLSLGTVRSDPNYPVDGQYLSSFCSGNYHFCMDCLGVYWEAYGRQASADAVTERYEQEDEEMQDGQTLPNSLPKLIPAVEFYLQYPDAYYRTPVNGPKSKTPLLRVTPRPE